MRRVGLAVLALFAVLFAGVAALFGSAHLGVRAERPALPDLALVLAEPDGDLPSGLFVVDTARQPMPRSGVLEPDGDPDARSAYVMTHTAFVLAWPDGRLFVFDTGMDRDAALAFGRPLERFAGADAITPLGSLAEQLGPATARVRGLALSHLHVDHTSGLAGLCEHVDASIPLFQTPGQHDEGNYTTWQGRAQLAQAACVRATPLAADALVPVPGFPGLFLVPAAGHTPGSQVLVAHLATAGAQRIWVFTGDTVNHRDAIAHDVPKPRLYSLLVVPEDPARMAALRHWLAALQADPRVRIAVSHDARELAAPAWPRTLSEVPASLGAP